MALKLAKVAGEKKKVAAPPNTDLGIPTTQVKMGTKASTRHDPLSTVSIMDQLKTATPSAATSKGLSRPMSIGPSRMPTSPKV